MGFLARVRFSWGRTGKDGLGGGGGRREPAKRVGTGVALMVMVLKVALNQSISCPQYYAMERFKEEFEGFEALSCIL